MHVGNSLVPHVFDLAGLHSSGWLRGLGERARPDLHRMHPPGSVRATNPSGGHRPHNRYRAVQPLTFVFCDPTGSPPSPVSPNNLGVLAFVGEGGETNPAALGLDRRRGVRLGQFDSPSCPGTCLSRGLDPPPRRAHITGFSLLGSLAAVREDGTSRAFAGVRFPWARAGGAGVSLSSALILSRALNDYRPFPSQPGPVGLS